MTDYSELVQRLRLLQEHLQDGDAGEAADAIEAQAKRIAELESQLNRANKALEPFAKQLKWKFGKYIGGLMIVAKCPHEGVKDEMTFKLHDFRMAHLIWENKND